MPRPQIKRHVCCLPLNEGFLPCRPQGEPPVSLAIDEYETLRLIDLEGSTQEECAGQMGISRSTVQAIYNTARYKVADALVNGRGIKIGGGDIVVCGCCGKQCSRGCHKRCHRREKETEEFT